MKRIVLVVLAVIVAALALAVAAKHPEQRESFVSCLKLHLSSRSLLPLEARKIADEPHERFTGKPELDPSDPRSRKRHRNRLLCRGGRRAFEHADAPWIDWSNYWGAADASSLPEERFPWSLWPDRLTGPRSRGVKSALIDLEYQRMELIRFNLFDNHTYGDYVGVDGRTQQTWSEMRDEKAPPCWPHNATHRTLTGICNDLDNSLMGSTGRLLARNVAFESTFPEGDRIGLHRPDPREISKVLFSRPGNHDSGCNGGRGRSDSAPGQAPAAGSMLSAASREIDCGYREAPWFNVLAAFWIQFMTHDWFSHLEEGVNDPELISMSCDEEEVEAGQCSDPSRVDRAIVADDGPPPTSEGVRTRAHKTFRNTVTAWWDASQIYGYDETSAARVKRDGARLRMVPRGGHGGTGETQGYLPLLEACTGELGDPDCVPDPMNPAWRGQEATAFPDNFTVGLSFYHNLFAREHNLFVDAFRQQTPSADSGLRDPADPERPILYGEVSDERLFEVARLVVAAEIAKIHTVEWTTQLLYNEPLYQGMNANWNGLLDAESHPFLRKKMAAITARLKESEKEERANQWYSVFASGPGIFGLGSEDEDWQMTQASANGGINHFGSPFNFPEEFVTVYRLHPLVPDLLEYRDPEAPNRIAAKVPMIDTFRAGSARAMDAGGLAGWAVSMGRQRLGELTLGNHPRFLQNLPIERLPEPIDVAALDLLRDRERGVPRYNEFRRQYGLRHLTSFDQFADDRLENGTKAEREEYRRQLEWVGKLREVYGQHRCDDSKVIRKAQLLPDDKVIPAITDCLGHDDGYMVDNIEDVDAVVGWLAEFRRPHGFAISETQFVVFILNASRRLFSDRFFTSSFRPEFYSFLGYDWVTFNGPCPEERQNEAGRCAKQLMTVSNGTPEPVSPLKRILLRTMPDLEEELRGVVNAFDPWARDRGEYYSLEWTPRTETAADESFAPRRADAAPGPETVAAGGGR